MACTCLVHLHGINTLYHAVSVYTGMHKTLETLETLALRARVSKPVSAVLYIPVYTSTAWYNLYLYGRLHYYYSFCHLRICTCITEKECVYNTIYIGGRNFNTCSATNNLLSVVVESRWGGKSWALSGLQGGNRNP